MAIGSAVDEVTANGAGAMKLRAVAVESIVALGIGEDEISAAASAVIWFSSGICRREDASGNTNFGMGLTTGATEANRGFVRLTEASFAPSYGLKAMAVMGENAIKKTLHKAVLRSMVRNV